MSVEKSSSLLHSLTKETWTGAHPAASLQILICSVGFGNASRSGANCTNPYTRIFVGTSNDMSSSRLPVHAENRACFTVLSGKRKSARTWQALSVLGIGYRLAG